MQKNITLTNMLIHKENIDGGGENHYFLHVLLDYVVQMSKLSQLQT